MITTSNTGGVLEHLRSALPTDSTFFGLGVVRRPSIHMPRRFVLFVLLIAGLVGGMTAKAADTITSIHPPSAPMDLSGVTADPYELALTQVLGEVCPPLLNVAQRQKFMTAYQTRLRSFMPSHLNANAALRQIGSQRSYRDILQNVRTWTLSYPVTENKALCVEFAETMM